MDNIFDCSDCLKCRKAAAEKAFEDARKVQEEASKEPKILFKQLIKTDISEKSYICIKCGFETRTRPKIRWHNVVVHGYIGKGGSKFRTYEKKYFEQKEEHGSALVIECRVCEFTTIFRNEMTQHIKIDHNSYEGSSVTNVLVGECNSQIDLTFENKTQKIKASGTAKIYECPKCEITSKTKKGVKQHLMQVHGLNEKLECQKCDFTSIVAVELKKHRLVHKTNLFECDICENFRGRKDVLGIHSRKKLLQCKKCAYKTHLRVELKAHKKKQHSLVCQKCDFTSLDAAELKNHRLVHNTNLFKCDICEDFLGSKNALGIHSRKKLLQCKKCDYKTHLRVELNSHKKKQHYQLACKACNKGFKKVTLFDNHNLRHHNAKEELVAGKENHKTLQLKSLQRKENSYIKKEVSAKSLE